MHNIHMLKKYYTCMYIHFLAKNIVMPCNNYTTPSSLVSSSCGGSEALQMSSDGQLSSS